MRLALLFALLIVAVPAAAQAPDSSAVPVEARVTEQAPRPLGIQIAAGSLGAAVGGFAGAYAATGGDDGLDSLGGALFGGVVGTLFGATLAAQGVGRQDRTGSTLGGAALGLLGGALVASAIAPDDDESVVPLIVFTLSVGTGAALGNRGID